MTTTGTKSLRIDRRMRHEADATIDELFEELVRDAEWAKGLLDFARDLYDENNNGTVNASAVFAFVESVRMPMENVVDAIAPIIYELQQREAEGRA